MKGKGGKKERERFGGDGDLYGLGMGGPTRVWPVVWQCPSSVSFWQARRQAGKNWVTRKERNGRIHCCDDGGPAGPRLVQGGRVGNNSRQLFFSSLATTRLSFAIWVLGRLLFLGFSRAVGTTTPPTIGVYQHSPPVYSAQNQSSKSRKRTASYSYTERANFWVTGGGEPLLQWRQPA